MATENKVKECKENCNKENGKENNKNKCWYRFVGDEDVDNTDTTSGMIWRGFKNRTTAHGIPHVDKGRGAFKKGYWSAISLGCVAVLIWQLYRISSTFLSYKVDVVITLAHHRVLTFPSVTLCNINPVKRSALHNNTQLSDLLLSATHSPSTTDEDVVCRNSSVDSYSIQEAAIEILAQLSDAEKHRLTYAIDDIMLDCRYAGSRCYNTEFSSYFDPVYGNCFLFNSGWNDLDLEQSKRAGRRHGLQIVVHIHQEEYVNELAEGAGVRVVVHPQDRMPFPSDEGILASPGQLTSIGVRQVEIERLGYNFGNCTYVDDSEETINVYEQHFKVNYSINACYKTCYQRSLIESCGCADAQIPTTGKAFPTDTADVCRSSDYEQCMCKEEVSAQYQSGTLDCHCAIPCRETGYNFEVSSVEWPSEANENNVLSTYETEIQHVLNSNDISKEVRNNLLKLEIYFQEFNFEKIDERPAYANASYASDWGGLLGLWIGCSVLSLFEFVELFVDFLVLGGYKLLGLDLLRNCATRCKTGLHWKASRGGIRIPDTPPPPYSSTENVHEGGAKRAHEGGAKRAHARQLYLEDIDPDSLKYV